MTLLIDVQGLSKSYRNKTILKDINLSIHEGEIVGLMGASGSGKSTLSRLILQLEKPDNGAVFFQGVNLCSLSSTQLKPYRKQMQAIFQDPYSSLNPMMKIRQIIEEPARIHGTCCLVDELLDKVQLERSVKECYPHQLSGGMRQRVAIARALVLNPKVIVCDEILSALDACTQLQIIRLLVKLQKESGLALLFISHDLRVVEALADRVVCLNRGQA